MRHVIACLFLLVGLLALGHNARADEEALYQGSVLVNSQGPGEKAGALQRAPRARSSSS